jgi:hypothetical protein
VGIHYPNALRRGRAIEKLRKATPEAVLVEEDLHLPM